MNSVTIKNLPILTKLPDVRQQFKPRSLQHVLSKDSTKCEICKLVKTASYQLKEHMINAQPLP